jgi:hypothetical protein
VAAEGIMAATGAAAEAAVVGVEAAVVGSVVVEAGPPAVAGLRFSSNLSVD